MKTHRQGRTGAASAVSRELHARRLWAALWRICGQLRRAQRDPVARQAYRAVEKELARQARQWKGDGRGRAA